MARHPIAHVLPHPLPPLPTTPHPTPSPLQTVVNSTLSSTDYDTICVPLTNSKWQERWERLCLRTMDEDDDIVDDGNMDPRRKEMLIEKEKAREAVDREADTWRKEGGLRREEVVISRLEETQHLIGLASEWLELDSPDEGIRFDSELALRSEVAQALYLALPVLILPAPNLANRAYLPSYARAVANLLQLGGPSAVTQLSIRIPVSDPVELIHQGPAPSPFGGLTPGVNGHGAPPSSYHGAGMSESTSMGVNTTSKSHKRISSLSTRPASIHQAQLAALNINGGGASTAPSMRIPSATGSIASGKAPSLAAGTVASGDPSSTWEMWDCIRTLCGYHPRLTVTLDLSNPLPPSVGALSRWTAEPTRNIWLPAGSFIPNGKGYPVLSKACQAFLRGMSKQNPTFILSDTTLQKHSAGGPLAYLQYVRHITSTATPTSTSTSSGASGPSGSLSKLVENGTHDYAQGYGDYLQAPLQPLMDDLGSATYDVFERDPVKYRKYEEAIFLALSDLPGDRRHVVTVAGAGRGPLVACTLRALEKANRQASVYAVEKNPNAFVTLQERKALEWQDSVQIIYGDMRTLDVPEEADILVSELLGSFGDNELSPECLDGAMRFLKETGISIPTSYTAHVAPISSSKLHHDVTLPTRAPGAAETPYVVMLQQVNLLSGDGGGVTGRCGERIQQCWQFEHPRRDLILDASGAPLTNAHNTRSSTHTFHIPHASTLHGLAGYFEAHLYSNIGLSIHPENMHQVSPDMFSWFPLFFPLKQPLYLPSGAELDVNLWRLIGGKKVWYEWCCEAFLPVSGGAGLNSASGGRIVSGTSSLGVGSGIAPGGGGGQPSPMMDAPFSPSFPIGTNGGGAGEVGRIKIGQTSLHNPGGVSSWVGL